MRARFAFVLFIAATWLWSPTRAAAAEPSTILVLTDPEDAQTAAKLRAEIERLGLRVIVREATGAPHPAAIEAETRAAGAGAAMRVSRSPRGIEVWVVDRITGKTSLRELVESEAAEPDLVAIRAVELLRASFLELQLPHEPRGDIAADPPVEALATPPAREDPPRWFLGVRGGMHVSEGGIDPAGVVGLGLLVRPHDHLAVEGIVLAPVSSPTVEAAEGSSTAFFSFAAIGGRAFVAAPSSIWNFYGGPRIGLLWLHVDGTAEAPYAGVSDDVVAPVVAFNTGVYVSPASAVRLELDADVVLTLTHPRIRFAEREVGAWGRPAFLGTLGVAFALD